MKRDLTKADISKLERFSELPYLYSDAVAMYYGLDDMGKTSLEDIAVELNDIFEINVTPNVVEHIICEALEMLDFRGDLSISDSERVITIDSPDSDHIRICTDMQRKYECKAVYAVNVDAEDKEKPVKKLILVALNEQGLRKIDSIMKTGYKNPDGIYVRNYSEILKGRKDSYLIGQAVNWKYFLNRRNDLEDELKFEMMIREDFKDADFVVFPRLKELYYEINPEVLIYKDESMAYDAKDFEKAREAAAVAAIMLEKRDIVPMADLDTLLTLPSDILDYIYFCDEARRAVVLNPASIADKADCPKIV